MQILALIISGRNAAFLVQNGVVFIPIRGIVGLSKGNRQSNIFPLPMPQKAFSLDTVTLKKIGKSVLLVMAGTFLAFLSDNLAQIIGAFSFSPDVKVVLAGCFTIIINAIREYVKGIPNKQTS